MPRKLSDRARLITDYLRGGSRGLPGPGSILVETTVRCNLRCPMCPRTGAGYPNEEMPDDMIYPLLEEFARLGGDHIYLYGLGEPLLDPRIYEILGRCNRLGLGTVVSTNATLLDGRAREALLDSGCEHLIVGVDGANADTYAYYREGGVYEEVVANIKALAAAKYVRSSEMTLVVQMVRMARNMAEVPEFLEFWKSVPGVDLVRIKDEDIGLPEHAIYEADGHRRENPCHILWRGPMVVRYNGDVFPCYNSAEHGQPLGNLKDKGLEELWNSREIQDMRILHAQGRSSENPLCANCPSGRPRLPFILGAMALKGITVRKLMPIAERFALGRPTLYRESRQISGQVESS